MKIILGIILSLFTSLSWAIADCPTHQVCTNDTACECRIGASSGSERYYYLDFPELQKGHIYQCDFHDMMGTLSGVLDKSTFPVGTVWQLQGTNARFPMTLKIDTIYMDQDTDKLVIKFFVPGSDMPNTVTGTCITVA